MLNKFKSKNIEHVVFDYQLISNCETVIIFIVDAAALQPFKCFNHKAHERRFFVKIKIKIVQQFTNANFSAHIFTTFRYSLIYLNIYLLFIHFIWFS